MKWNWRDYTDTVNSAIEQQLSGKQTPLDASVHLLDLLKIDEPGQSTDKLVTWRWAKEQNQAMTDKDRELAKSAVDAQMKREQVLEDAERERQQAIEDAYRDQAFAKERFDWQKGIEAIGLDNLADSLEFRIEHLQPDLSEVYSLNGTLTEAITNASKAGRQDLVDEFKRLQEALYGHDIFKAVLEKANKEFQLANRERDENRYKELNDMRIKNGYRLPPALDEEYQALRKKLGHKPSTNKPSTNTPSTNTLKSKWSVPPSALTED